MICAKIPGDGRKATQMDMMTFNGFNNMDETLSYLKKSIKLSKVGQAKNLLSQFLEKPFEKKLEALQIVAIAPDKTALELLSYLIQNSRQDIEFYDRIIQLILDRAHLNFNFALILYSNADKKYITQAFPLMRHILKNETNKDILDKTIKIIGEDKIKELTDDIAEFIYYDDKLLKIEAIRSLEKIGSPLAFERLLQAAASEKCDKDILNAIKVLKDEFNSNAKEPTKTSLKTKPLKKEGFEKEFANLASPNINTQFEAFLYLSNNLDKALPKLIQVLDTKNHDLIFWVLQLLSKAISNDAIDKVSSLIHDKKMEPNLKFAAYQALESYPELKSAASFISGLSESLMHVRLAAISVLDKNLSDFIGAEIKSKIESGSKKGVPITETILDAQAEKIIDYLMVSDSFSYIASNYLSGHAPTIVLKSFLNVLEKRKQKATIKRYQDIIKQKEEDSLNYVAVISSSDLVLKTYIKLISSIGLKTIAFHNSQDAFETIVEKKPALIICDLFLNDMTGFDFTKEIRQLYSKIEVPVMLSALQKSLDNKRLQKELDDSQANTICTFPAKTAQLKSNLVKS